METILKFSGKLSGIDATVLKDKLIGTTGIKIKQIKKDLVLAEKINGRKFLFKKVNPENAESLFLKDKISVLTEVDFPISSRAKLEKYPSQEKIAGTYYLAFNNRKGNIFSDQKLRNSIIKQFDTEDFVLRTGVNGIAAKGMIPKGYLGYGFIEKENAVPTTIRKSRKKKIILGMRKKFKSNLKIEEYFKAFFNKYNLLLEVRYLPFIDVLNNMRNGKFDMILKGDAPLNNEAVNSFISFVDINMKGLTGFESKKLESLYRSYEQQREKVNKISILRKMEELFQLEAPAIPLYYPTFKTWYQKKFENKIQNKISGKFWDFSYRDL